MNSIDPSLDSTSAACEVDFVLGPPNHSAIRDARRDVEDLCGESGLELRAGGQAARHQPSTNDDERLAADSPSDGLHTDSLAASMVCLGAMTVAQKLIGLVRNVLFCSVLLDDELGRWSLAHGFLGLAAPLIMLGLPGTFGRYVEHYRQRGQLRQFLCRIAIACGAASAMGVAVLLAFPAAFAWMVFGEGAEPSLLCVTAATLAVVVVFNFITELLIALRQMRLVSVMQFVSSVLFAAVGIALAWGTPLRENSVLIGFLASSAVASAVAVPPLLRIWRELPPDSHRLSHGEMWRRLLPFTGWVWMSMLLINLFEASDRIMIVHCTPARFGHGDALVGQYHCSRIIPLMMLAAVATIATVLVPHLSCDWEAGRIRAVSRRMNMSIKLVGALLTAAGAAVLLSSPLLFGWLLRGKYDAGLAALPMTLTYCTWASLGALLQTFLACAEKNRYTSLAYAFSLAANIGLNLALLPLFGLWGAVAATATTNAFALALVWRFCRRFGLEWDAGVIIAAALPLLLCAGWAPAIAGLIVIGAVSWRTNRFLSVEEKRLLSDLAESWMARIPGWSRRLSPELSVPADRQEA